MERAIPDLKVIDERPAPAFEKGYNNRRSLFEGLVISL
jgi:hypothetical protein